MGFSRCLHCGQDVQLPDVPETGWVQCPLCEGTYRLQDLIGEQPPRLKVVPPPAADIDGSQAAIPKLQVHPPSAKSERGPHKVSGVLVGGQTAERALSSPAESAKVSLVISSGKGRGVRPKRYFKPVDIPSPSLLDAERRRGSMRHDRFVVVKVLLGGIVGLVLGQLALWWLPSPYRSDPLALATKLPTRIGFFAPASLREGADQTVSTASDNSTRPGTNRSSDSSADDAIDSSEKNTESLSQESLQFVQGLAQPSRFRLEALLDAYDMAVAATRQHQAQNFDDKTWYATLSELAYRVTFASTEEEGIDSFAQQTREFLLKAIHSQAAIGACCKQTRRVLERVDRNRTGVVIFGDVLRVQAVGELFQTEIELAGAEPMIVHLVSRVDPRSNSRSTFDVNDRVLILGVTVTEPSRHLAAYKGNADLVVLGGLPINLGPALQSQDEPDADPPITGNRG